MAMIPATMPMSGNMAEPNSSIAQVRSLHPTVALLTAIGSAPGAVAVGDPQLAQNPPRTDEPQFWQKGTFPPGVQLYYKVCCFARRSECLCCTCVRPADGQIATIGRWKGA